MVRRVRGAPLVRSDSLGQARASGGTSLLLMFRAVRPVAAWLMLLLVIGTASAQTPAHKAPAPHRTAPARSAPAAAGGVIEAIQVEGNQRIEEGTIRSYLLVQPGDRFDPDR